jgi:ADP-ribosyltransferase exoenzyme
LDSSVARAELPEATKLYRGVDADGLKAMLAEYHLSVGTVISDHGFVSTSRLPEVAKHNAGQGGITMVISAPKGSHAADISSFTHYPGEKEMLIGRNQAMRVTGYNPRNRRLSVSLQ